jgi:hypothetical protein
MSLDHHDLISPESLRVLGEEIRDHFVRQAALGPYCFGQELPSSCNSDVVSAELVKARNRANNYR